MSIGRILLLCLITLTLGLTGPLTRGLAAAPALPAIASASTTMADVTTSAAPAKRCQRGAIIWSNCHFDIGIAATVASRTHSGAVSAIEIRHQASSDNPSMVRIFRPPRSS